MKRFLITLLIAVTAASSIFATSINSTPVATVRLTKNKVITQAELDSAMTAYQGTGATEADVLQLLINDEVFLQGAERDGVTVNDTQLNSLYAQQKSAYEQQTGVTLTTAQFDEVVAANYGSVDAFKEQLKQSYIVNTYLMQEKGEQLQNGNYTPTDTEIRSFYRKNQTGFVMAETVKFSSIYMAKTGDAAADAQKKATLEQVAADIKSGRITFEAAVNQYTEDEESKAVGGETGWLTSDNTQARQVFGDDFVDTVLGLSVGVVSDVIESNIGYHIVKNTVHYDARLLGINDRIQPDQSVTVYQYIQAGLSQQMQQQAMSDALNEIIADLTSQARINIIKK